MLFLLLLFFLECLLLLLTIVDWNESGTGSLELTLLMIVLVNELVFEWIITEECCFIITVLVVG